MTGAIIGIGELKPERKTQDRTTLDMIVNLLPARIRDSVRKFANESMPGGRLVTT